jgi:hypothetical protein
VDNVNNVIMMIIIYYYRLGLVVCSNLEFLLKFYISLDIWQDSLDMWSARRKASTYTGQHNAERREQHPSTERDSNHDPSISATKNYVPDYAATEIGKIQFFNLVQLNNNNHNNNSNDDGDDDDDDDNNNKPCR